MTQEKALEIMMEGNNVFLTGEAGTGKSYLVQEFIKKSRADGKKVIVSASTGVAATMIGGATVHSVFGLGIRMHRVRSTDWFNQSKRSVLVKTDILIMDEISMLRADAFASCVAAIQEVNEERDMENLDPMQVVVVGDFFQLPPVISNDERRIFKKVGLPPSGYCCFTEQWDEMKFTPVILTEVKRQSDPYFCSLLSRIRKGDGSCAAELNRYVRKNLPDDDDAVRVYPYNAGVEKYNNRRLDDMNGKVHVFDAIKHKTAPTNTVLVDSLQLKVGTRVMILANDPSKDNLYVNGTTGVVTGFYGPDDDYLAKFGIIEDDDDGDIDYTVSEDAEFINDPNYVVYVGVATDDGRNVRIERFDAENVVYDLDDDGDIVSKVIGTVSQFPLKPSYAVTMHKSQGQTWDRVHITPGSSHPGQFYVAVSRVTSLEGLSFSSEVQPAHIWADEDICRFYAQLEEQERLREIAEKSAEMSFKGWKPVDVSAYERKWDVAVLCSDGLPYVMQADAVNEQAAMAVAFWKVGVCSSGQLHAVRVLAVQESSGASVPSDPESVKDIGKAEAEEKVEEDFLLWDEVSRGRTTAELFDLLMSGRDFHREGAGVA